MSYTPGPWQIDNFHTGTSRYQITAPESSRLIASIWQHFDRNNKAEEAAQDKENAQLIANAPAMLRALEIISNFTKCQCAAEHGDNPNCPIVIAKAAIAKATKGE